MAVRVYTPSLSTSTQNRQNYYGPLNDEVAWASRAETKPGMTVPDSRTWVAPSLSRKTGLGCSFVYWISVQLTLGKKIKLEFQAMIGQVHTLGYFA